MPIAPIAIAAMAIGTVVQTYGSFQAAAAQRRMARAQQAQAALEAQNQRLEQVRQARISAARSIQMANNQGAGESSSATTAASGFQNQAASNIHYINDQQDVNQQITSAKIQMANAQGLEDLGGGVSKLGGLGLTYGDYLKQKTGQG